MAARSVTRFDAARRVRHFVGGTRRLAITGRALAELLGIVEEECLEVLEAMVARGLLRKDRLGQNTFLYCKD